MKAKQPICFFCGKHRAKLGIRIGGKLFSICPQCDKLKHKAKQHGIGVTLQGKTWKPETWRNYNLINPLREV